MLKRLYYLILLVFLYFPLTASANPFEGGWQLQTGQSTIGFLSVKKGTIAEYSGFASFSGQIDPTGAAEIVIAMDSVDTKIDLRNVRMRFLFFETFKHGEARIKATIPPELVADLPSHTRKTVDLSVSLTLHGIETNLTAPVAVTLMDNNTVNVSTVQPIILSLADFDLLIAYCPNYAEGYNQRAFVNYLRRDFARALVDLERALALSPRHVAAMSGRALSLYGLGRLEEARIALESALAYNPWLTERYLLAPGGPLDMEDVEL